MTDKTPCEFWITLREDGNPTHIALLEKRTDRPQIHVIEFRAYEELQKQKEYWYNKFADLETNRASCCSAIEQENATLREALEKVVILMSGAPTCAPQTDAMVLERARAALQKDKG